MNSNWSNTVDKFWAGETSLQEEQWLKSMLSNTEFTTEFPELVSYLDYTQQMGALEVPKEQAAQQIQVRNSSSILSWNSLVLLALFIGLLLSIYFFTEQANKEEPNTFMAGQSVTDTYTDPEVAFAEVKKALFVLSGKMNKGVNQATKLSDFSKAEAQITTKN